MNLSFDIWKLLAGVAIFLLGISFLEDTLKFLAGRKFKLFLKQQTGNPVKAILGGTAVTALMQSSSVVNLLVLSLTGAGVLQMNNALALMLGSNLGSTFTSWIIATFGFKINIEANILPLLALGGIAMAYINKSSLFFQWCKFFVGFSFLFLGLGYMNDGMEAFVKSTELSRFAHFPAIVFILVGLVLTALVQASSVTIALTLSALFTHAIDLYMAAAFVLGAEIGTTLKLALASVNGLAVKKRVALGNILFNTVTALLIFPFLNSILYFITGFLKISNEMYALVLFQTLINIAGIILFFPLLNLLGRFLEKRFKNESEAEFLKKISVQDSDLAIDAIVKETRHLLLHHIKFSVHAFALAEENLLSSSLPESFGKKPVEEMYQDIKLLYGEIHQFCIRLQGKTVEQKETEQLFRLINCNRNIMYGAKSVKDALPDIHQLKNSSNEVKFQFYTTMRQRVNYFYSSILLLLQTKDAKQNFDWLTKLYRQVQNDYTAELKQFYEEQIQKQLSQHEISTLLNFNREMITSFKSILFALKDYLLTSEEAIYFDELPGFIR